MEWIIDSHNSRFDAVHLWPRCAFYILFKQIYSLGIKLYGCMLTLKLFALLNNKTLYQGEFLLQLYFYILNMNFLWGVEYYMNNMYKNKYMEICIGTSVSLINSHKPLKFYSIFKVYFSPNVIWSKVKFYQMVKLINVFTGFYSVGR